MWKEEFFFNWIHSTFWDSSKKNSVAFGHQYGHINFAVLDFRTLPTPYFTLLLAGDCQCRSETLCKEGTYYGRIHLSGSHRMSQLPGYQMFGLSADAWISQPAFEEQSFVRYFHFIVKRLSIFNYHRPQSWGFLQNALLNHLYNNMSSCTNLCSCNVCRLKRPFHFHLMP